MTTHSHKKYDRWLSQNLSFVTGQWQLFLYCEHVPNRLFPTCKPDLISGTFFRLALCHKANSCGIMGHTFEIVTRLCLLSKVLFPVDGRGY